MCMTFRQVLTASMYVFILKWGNSFCGENLVFQNQCFKGHNNVEDFILVLSDSSVKEKALSLTQK